MRTDIADVTVKSAVLLVAIVTVGAALLLTVHYYIGLAWYLQEAANILICIGFAVSVAYATVRLRKVMSTEASKTRDVH